MTLHLYTAKTHYPWRSRFTVMVAGLPDPENTALTLIMLVVCTNSWLVETRKGPCLCRLTLNFECYRLPIAFLLFDKLSEVIKYGRPQRSPK